MIKENLLYIIFAVIIIAGLVYLPIGGIIKLLIAIPYTIMYIPTHTGIYQKRES